MSLRGLQAEQLHDQRKGAGGALAIEVFRPNGTVWLGRGTRAPRFLAEVAPKRRAEGADGPSQKREKLRKDLGSQTTEPAIE
jgi:hypothetical protein